DVDLGTDVHQRDREAPRLEDRSDGGGGHPLAEGGHHAAGNEDVLGRHAVALLLRQNVLKTSSTLSRSSAVSTLSDPRSTCSTRIGMPFSKARSCSSASLRSSGD